MEDIFYKIPLLPENDLLFVSTLDKDFRNEKELKKYMLEIRKNKQFEIIPKEQKTYSFFDKKKLGKISEIPMSNNLINKKSFLFNYTKILDYNMIQNSVFLDVNLSEYNNFSLKRLSNLGLKNIFLVVFHHSELHGSLIKSSVFQEYYYTYLGKYYKLMVTATEDNFITDNHSAYDLAFNDLKLIDFV